MPHILHCRDGQTGGGEHYPDGQINRGTLPRRRDKQGNITEKDRQTGEHYPDGQTGKHCRDGQTNRGTLPIRTDKQTEGNIAQTDTQTEGNIAQTEKQTEGEHCRDGQTDGGEHCRDEQTVGNIAKTDKQTGQGKYCPVSVTISSFSVTASLSLCCPCISR